LTERLLKIEKTLVEGSPNAYQGCLYLIKNTVLSLWLLCDASQTLVAEVL